MVIFFVRKREKEIERKILYGGERERKKVEMMRIEFFHFMMPSFLIVCDCD